MSFMNAKEARPVEDASALVPFGWAPGGYHCAACSTCGEAHSGSDKRSMRCQDCAEALRDKRADKPAPTTRETADHAELARTLEALAVEASSARNIDGAESMMVSVQTIYDLIVSRNALLSEIAALRGDLAKTERDYSELRDSYDAVVAKLAIERDHGAKQSTRATQAERQRDELRKALERLASSEAFETPRVIDGPLAPEMRARMSYAHQALANQGADQ